MSIKKYDISIDSKTNEKIGTFYCKCEFVYSRKMKADIYVVGRVKKYGVTWETKLKGLIS
ncbi:TnsD family Tn7-like transposition protein [Clostridium estertheticum]|uniref:TnsD family Tn7-like transposition protein n=1 Tax=Clostridium estertheticum TaxID=238834 RepID=UPI0027146AD3|nr:TnsD family Tn7-like transposition protein [Clostridium estertheticum]